MKHYDKSNWKKVRLGDIVDIFSGGTPKTSTPEYWNGDILWCTPTDITANEDKYISDTEQKISALGLQNSATRLLPENTLLLCSRATIGAVKIATKPICTNQGFKNLVCKDVMDTDFLYYYIPKLKPQMIFLASGSTFLEISKKQLAGIEFTIPTTKSEQVYIANVLSKIDSAITNLQKLISKQESIKKTTLKLLLEPKSDWNVFYLGQLGIFYGGLSGKTKNDFIDGNAKYITYNNVYKNIIINPDQLAYVRISSTEHQNEVFHGDILFTQSSETLEEVGFSSAYMLETHCYLNSFCFGFRPHKDRIDSIFFAYFTHSNLVRKEIMKAAQGITRINLSAERLKKIKIHLPDIQTQKRIATQLSEIDAHIENLKQQLAKQRAIKQGLMDYFFGN